MRFNIEKLRKFGTSSVIHLALILVSLACLFPLLWAFASSLKTQSTIFSNFAIFPESPRWINYSEAWSRANFGLYLINSLFYSAVVVLCVILIASLAAFAFSRLKFPGKNILFILLISTMMIPIPATIIPLYVLVNKLGLINTRLGYVLLQINAGLALGVFLLKTFFDDLPKELEDSARIDGCSRFRVYWHIALPLAKPAIVVLAIFNILNVWNEYILASLVLADKNLMPLQRGLMVFQGAYITDYPLLMAGIMITTIPILIVYLILQKHLIKGIAAGAVIG